MKKIFLTLLTFIFSVFCFAQSGDILRDKLDSIFGNVNKSVIPTGYLQEYGTMFLPLHCLNGILTDSNIVESLDLFRYAYADLSTAKIITSLPSMPTITVVNNAIDSARAQGNNTTDRKPNQPITWVWRHAG